MAFWDSPHASAFIQDVCGLLAAGREHCILVIPQLYHDAFLANFRKKAEYRLGMTYTAKPGRGDNPLDMLKPAFCINGEMPPASCEDLVSLPARDDAVLILRYPDEKCETADILYSFAEKARDVARACKNMNLALPWRMACIISPGTKFPEADLGFSYHNWWGKFFASDLEFIIEEELAPLNLGLPAWYWFYSLCRGLCTGAPDLVGKIARNAPADQTQIRQVLCRHRFYTKQMGQLVNDLLDNFSLPSRNMIPVNLPCTAWDKGILEIGALGQPLLHPAALLAAGHEKLVDRQILSGQIQIYLPLVQEVIHFLYNRFEKKFGEKWYGENEEKVQEIGGLLNYINVVLTQKEDIRQERELAHLWWRIRTALAHYTMIPVQLALKAVYLYEMARKDVSV